MEPLVKKKTICKKCNENLMVVAMHKGLAAIGARSSWDADRCEFDYKKHEWIAVPIDGPRP